MFYFAAWPCSGNRSYGARMKSTTVNPCLTILPTWTIRALSGYLLITLSFPTRLQQLWWTCNQATAIQLGSVKLCVVFCLTMSSKKNQACWRAPSLTLPLLTTHCSASSSWNNWDTETHGPDSQTGVVQHIRPGSTWPGFSWSLQWNQKHLDPGRWSFLQLSTERHSTASQSSII